MRGDLVSRPIGDVLTEAKALLDGGVRELLIISQDTSAYGVDVKYRTGFGMETRQDTVARIGAVAGGVGGTLWCLGPTALRVPYPSVDELVPLMASGLILPYLDVPFNIAILMFCNV